MNHAKWKRNENMEWIFDSWFSQFYNHLKEALASGLEREEGK